MTSRTGGWIAAAVFLALLTLSWRLEGLLLLVPVHLAGSLTVPVSFLLLLLAVAAGAFSLSILLRTPAPPWRRPDDVP